MAETELEGCLQQLARYRIALAVIAAGGCENFTSGSSCRSPNSGKQKGSPYGAYSWCAPCVATDELEAGRG